MNVKELIDKLSEYDPTAKVEVVVNSCPKDFDIYFGYAEGCTKDHCQNVSITVIEGMMCEER
jgi:hypothetical protein